MAALNKIVTIFTDCLWYIGIFGIWMYRRVIVPSLKGLVWGLDKVFYGIVYVIVGAILIIVKVIGSIIKVLIKAPGEIVMLVLWLFVFQMVYALIFGAGAVASLFLQSFSWAIYANKIIALGQHFLYIVIAAISLVQSERQKTYGRAIASVLAVVIVEIVSYVIYQNWYPQYFQPI